MQAENASKINQYVIVGGGIAGVSAAETIFAHEPDSEIILICGESTLPYFRMNLTRYLAGELEASSLPLHPEEWYPSKHITLMLETFVETIDPQEHLVLLQGGKRVHYDKLILATGASPNVPPIPGVDIPGVQTLRTIEDANRIQDASKNTAEVVCIGGGLLGLEVAGAIAHSGGKVTVLEAMPWLLPRQLDEPASKNLQARIESLGVKVIVGIKTQAIVGDDRVRAVILEDGTELKADLVVISAGIKPNIDLACKVGAAVNRGVLVDAEMRTSVEDILAAGDLCEYGGQVYGLWVPAKAQGRIAGLTAVGLDEHFSATPPSARLKVMGIDLFSIGKISPSEADEFCIAGEIDGNYYSFLFGRGLMLGAILIGNNRLSARIKRAVDNAEDFSAKLNRETPVEEILKLLS